MIINKLLVLGVFCISSLSIGFTEKCCFRKKVGDFFYNYIASEETKSYNCITDCVYSREGDSNPNSRYCFAPGKLTPVCQNSSDATTYHTFYSGLSSIHNKLRNGLTQEQLNLISLPASCADCKPPAYCWYGQCLARDAEEYPPGSSTDYIESIKELLKYISIKTLKYLFHGTLKPCSMERIECYGSCLPSFLDTAAYCIKKHSWTPLLGCIYENIKGCGPCICQIRKSWEEDHNCPSGDTKPQSHNCDRDCATSIPQTCVFDFKLETLKTDADGRRADGRLRSVLAYNGQIPGPPIVICEGDTLAVNFLNEINGSMTNADGSTNTTTLHFHGIREKSRPWSDGVPFVSQCPILPGDKIFSYGFNTDIDGAPPGTYWYHSHVGSQRTNGAYGALIIKGKNEYVYESNLNNPFVDNAANTLVLQEWYESSSSSSAPVSILINGNGRVGEQKLFGEDDEILQFLKGKSGKFQCVPHEEYIDKDSFTTNYTEFVVETSTSYRFRIIGAISQNVPLQLSIDEHTFTAISVDSLNIEPFKNLTNLWLSAGERYDIVVQTKPSASGTAYKIRVLGYADINNKLHPLCSIAWLKYPDQTIDYGYVTACNCSDFDLSHSGWTLNPVPNNFKEWKDSPENGKIFIKDLKSNKNQPTIDLDHLANLNTHYIEFTGTITFNDKRMKYPNVPFLLQNPENKTGRCGSICDLKLGVSSGLYTDCNPLECPSRRSEEEYCECQHVIQQPWAPGYWAETVLINNNNDTAHPIHQHGGWYWVVGMGMYPHRINRTFIMDQDKPEEGKKEGRLPRNYKNALAKDTLQIPQFGYAIIRTPLDNTGTWIVHCHINYHVELGMAMVLQIGEAGGDPVYGQDWCTGSLEQNTPCRTPPQVPPVPANSGGEGVTIPWDLAEAPKPNIKCVTPGTNVTFKWAGVQHNVNHMTLVEYKNCNVTEKNPNPKQGPHTWKAEAAKPEPYYFACGVSGHCSGGHMRVSVTVKDKCE